MVRSSFEVAGRNCWGEAETEVADIEAADWTRAETSGEVEDGDPATPGCSCCKVEPGGGEEGQPRRSSEGLEALRVEAAAGLR